MTEQKTHKRVNRFSGESVMLTREEAKKHDAIFYYEYMATEEDKVRQYVAPSSLRQNVAGAS